MWLCDFPCKPRGLWTDNRDRQPQTNHQPWVHYLNGRELIKTTGFISWCVTTNDIPTACDHFVLSKIWHHKIYFSQPFISPWTITSLPSKGMFCMYSMQGTASPHLFKGANGTAVCNMETKGLAPIIGHCSECVCVCVHASSHAHSICLVARQLYWAQGPGGWTLLGSVGLPAVQGLGRQGQLLCKCCTVVHLW